MKILQHFKTITHHKYLVLQGCLRVGLWKQGFLHDLSKYSPAEFLVGSMYYQGMRSPNNAEREARGYSTAWLHHKGRNKHHYEYWLDYGFDITGSVMPIAMPVKYVIEMFIDRIAAAKVYEKENYTDKSPLRYFQAGNWKNTNVLHPKTEKQLRILLTMLARKGEKYTYRYIRKVILRKGF